MTENNNNEEVKESLQMNECEIHEKNNQEKGNFCFLSYLFCIILFSYFSYKKCHKKI